MAGQSPKAIVSQANEAGEKMDNEKRLTILEHLQELRQRLLKSAIALLVTTIFSFIFAQQLFKILIWPTGGINLVFIEVTEMLGSYMRVSLLGGIFLAAPYLIYQFIMFVSPALRREEKKYVYFFLPWMVLMFAGGVAFGYFILLPPAIKFLLAFGGDVATPQIRIGNYISVVTRLLLAIGLVFELPVVISVLARLGVVTPKWLAQQRRAAILIAFVLAAIITPTSDPVNQLLVAVPLIILYEISIWLAKLARRKQSRLVTSSPTLAS